ncbi:hypothetical protein FRC03_010559 [Tulasnella sp. 419]|nr:hypothetical protein FRC03_010559 [Tulasnella sp. 419]
MDEPMRPSPAPLEVNFLETSVNGTDLRFTVYIGACQVTVFDVELSFDGSQGAIGGANSQADSMSYSFASPPVPMSQDKAMRVFSYLDDWEPGSGSLMNYYLTPALGPTVYGAISSTPGFSNTLADEFARQCLAYIAANGAKLVPANSVVNQSVKLVSRYPLAITMAYVAVVYAHGLLAIILFAGIVRKSSKTVVVDEPMQQVDRRGTLVSKKQKPVQELILVQSRLTDPLSIVAEHFLETESESQEKKKAYTSPGVLSAQTDAVAMFDVEGPDTKGVEVGLIDSQGSERWYGLRHRKKDILATMSDTEKAA